MMQRSMKPVLLLLLWLAFLPSLRAAEKALAPGHVPSVVKHLTAIGTPAATNELHLAIGLPLRNPAALAEFLTNLYTPGLPTYRHFLTPAEFTARFGPTEADYQSLRDFARAHHLALRQEHANRLLLDVSGSVADIDAAFHTRLRLYHDPDQARDFFAPETEPTVAANLPIADVAGLDNYRRPFPRVRAFQASTTTPLATGSAPGGGYFGSDFRAAYIPSTMLTGTGQSVGLVQFDGFYSNDIAAYKLQATLPDVPIRTVLLDNYNGVPTGTNLNNSEVSLDIELTLAMAPGLDSVIVYTAGSSGIPNDILNRMVTDNTARQLSCSWGWSGGPSATTDAIFQQMAAQGQSFFCASGDNDAYTSGASSANGVDNTTLANAPSDSPYLTSVGGTTLTTTGPGGAWSAEAVWNRGGGTGSGGGISSYYPLPSWQQGINFSASGGSTSFRNLPDVALVAENIYVISGNGKTSVLGGTSCATPLWAALTALANQQATNWGLPPVGFLNPTVYAVGKGGSYSTVFHDITTGNNFSSFSPGLYPAATGYDLCTGWGTPAGAALISALVLPPEPLGITPNTSFAATGPAGGPFSVASQTYTLTNFAATNLTWSLINTSAWLTVSTTSGTLIPLTSAPFVTVAINNLATNLPVGSYAATLLFSNQNTGIAQSRAFTLQITEPLLITPATGFTTTELIGGPFSPSTQTFTLTNLGASAWSWSLINTSLWLTASPTNGTLAPGGQTQVIVGLNALATDMPGGTFTNQISFTNALTGGVQTRSFILQVIGSLVQNGDFETGTLTSWTQSGNTAFTSVSSNAKYIHGGTHGLKAGPASTLGYLTQNLPTTPGQVYWVSVWLTNPDGGPPDEFALSWAQTKLFDQTNLAAFTWTNLQFMVTATNTSTPLQLAFYNNYSYFGVGDISVFPVTTPAIQVTNTAASISFTWRTTPGLSYTVQSTTNLLAAPWQTFIGATLATNTSMTFTTAPASEPQRFYRLAINPPQ